MALWKKGGYSRKSDESRETNAKTDDFDLILSDDDFEDEEIEEFADEEPADEEIEEFAWDESALEDIGEFTQDVPAEEAAEKFAQDVPAEENIEEFTEADTTEPAENEAVDACADDLDAGVDGVEEYYDLDAGVDSVEEYYDLDAGVDSVEEYYDLDAGVEGVEEYYDLDVGVEGVEEYYGLDDRQMRSAAGYTAAQGVAEEEYLYNEEDSREEYAGEFSAAVITQHGNGEEIQIMDLDHQEEDDDDDGAFAAFWQHLAENRIAIASSVLALLIFAVAAAVIFTGRGNETVSAFSTVSSDLEDVDVIGGQALVELMTSRDAEYQATLLSTSETETVSKEYEETDEEEEKIVVSLVMTSVEKDLKIKFTNAETGKLIANIPFEVKVVDGNGIQYTWTNDDKDGIIYKSGLTAGTYKIALVALDGDLYENYDFSASGTVTVRDTIAYEKVDVSAEIKDETEINVATEEAQVELAVESVNTDTVEWVESTKTLSSEEYTVIDKTLIAVPTATSVARSFLATAITNNTTSMTLTKGETGTISASSNADATLTYKSSDESVATVSENGTVTAVAAGSATITITETVTNEDGSTTESATESCSVTVNAKEEEKTYSAFSISASGLSLTKGGSGTVSVTASGATEGESLTYKYTSSDTSVATVSGSGSSASVTAVSTGTATITIKAYYTDKTDVSAETTCTVTVSQSYSDFSLSLSSSSLSINKNTNSTVTVTPQNMTSGESLTYTYTSSDTSVAEVYGSDNTVTVKGVGAGSATITVTACYTNNTSKTATASFTVTVTSSSTALKTTDGRAVYVLENGSYRTATYDDYYTDGMAYYVKSEAYKYTGWQTIDGNTYYYTAAGNYVVGEQVIQGVQYTFSSTGVLQDGSGTLGIDVSSHNGSIDWTAVKNSGVSYAIIRCGYRGYGTGVLVEDSRFRSNIQGALNAGLKVGVYFFSQAVTTTEAVEEASMVLQLISGYSISLPVYIDVEYSNSSHDGRADSLSVSERTAIVKAFCQTIANSGYTAGIYANKTWLTSYLDMSQLSSYRVWLAQYASSPTYSGSYHMWQYTSSGSISGISGNVDLNLWYY